MRPLLSLVVAVATALASASALAAPPSAPGDLRVDVYSGTAAELFWSRSTDPDGFVRGYEIRRDGELVDTRDGLSYFTDALTSGRAFSFTVTAIDSDGERSAPASVSVVGGDRDGSVGSGGGRPPPPANLRSEVYSSSAAELFWDRSDRRGLSYEVSRGGEVVTRTDGTSAFLSDLPSTDGQTFDVVAIDRNGQRSGAATVTLGDGGGMTDPDPDPDPDTDAPPAPANARIEVYSGTAAELFFDRAPADANVARTEIGRDGVIIGETVGTSFFDDSRSPGESYRYTLVAVSNSGERSAETVVGDADPSEPTSSTSQFANLLAPPATSSALSSESSSRFLPGIVAVANAAPLEAIRAMFEDLREKRGSGALDVLSTGRDETYACDGGGSFTVGPRDIGCSRCSTIIDHTFSACVDAGRTLDGTIALLPTTGSREIPYSDVSFVDEAGVRVTFDGTYDRVDTQASVFDQRYSWTGDWEVSGGGEALRVESFETIVTADVTETDDGSAMPVSFRRFTSSFDVTGPLTGGVELTATTPIAFAADGDDAYYDVGRFVVRAPDGSALAARANTGDVDTAGLTFGSGSNVTDTTVPWREEIRFAYGEPSTNSR